MPGQFPTVRTALDSGEHATRKSPEALKPLAERAPFTGAYANSASDLKTMILLADISRELEKLRWLLEVRLLLQKGKEPIPKLTDQNTPSRSQFAKR